MRKPRHRGSPGSLGQLLAPCLLCTIKIFLLWLSGFLQLLKDLEGVWIKKMPCRVDELEN